MHYFVMTLKPYFPRYLRTPGTAISKGVPQHGHQDRGLYRILITVTSFVLMFPQDEVLVGKDHPVVLSVAAPKEVSPCCSIATLINNKVVCHHFRL